MSLIPGIQSSGSALDAERIRLNAIAGNIANANTTRDSNGNVYRRQIVKFEKVLSDAQSKNGESAAEVRVSGIVDDPRPLRSVYMPGHPEADANGMVTMPNVNIAEEMVDMITAARSIEANVQVITTSKQMVMRALEIGRR